MAATIFAAATPPGRSAVAVVRISGPHTAAALAVLCGGPIPPDRRVRLRRLRRGGETLDEALVVAFPEGGSFTGEVSAELHLHGGSAVMAAVLAALGEIDGLRLARPGEFARRALEAGRLDLAQAEAIADLIDARTEAQRRLALRSLEGALGAQVARWRAQLRGALALLEAGIDFSDDGVPDGLRGEAEGLVGAALASLEAELAGAEAARCVREGFAVAVVGPPNVGKSSLYNALLRREAALVAPTPGTTRDVLEAQCDIAGLPVVLLDTAGLRDSDDPVEAAGVARARALAESADLRLVVTDGPEARPTPRSGDIVVASKADLGGPRPPRAVAVSAATGEGLSDLVAAIGRALAGRAVAAGAVVNARQAEAMRVAAACLRRVPGAADEIAAEEIRCAARALDLLIGRIDAEQVLDDIFARFCLGK